MELLTAARADDLGALLERINVRSVVYCLSDLGSPWGFRVDGSATAKFHLVLDGQATLTIDDPSATTAVLSAGEIALLPHGSGHLMQDRAGSAVPPLHHILAGPSAQEAERLAYGGSGPRTSLLCGGFALGSSLPDQLLSLLPLLLVLGPADAGPSGCWLEPAFMLLREHAASQSPGATAVLAKMADVFLTEVVRRYLSGLDAMSAAVPPDAGDDREVAAALALLRSEPGAPWTLTDLARKVDLSRTALAARFRERTGEPPMRYLARVRLGHAAGYLSTTDKTVRQIAHLVGYQNEASLSKAFRRAFGRAPGAYRREQRAANGVRATFAGAPPTSGAPATY
jgi:AraC-like DNA-binding protein